MNRSFMNEIFMENELHLIESILEMINTVPFDEVKERLTRVAFNYSEYLNQRKGNNDR